MSFGQKYVLVWIWLKESKNWKNVFVSVFTTNYQMIIISLANFCILKGFCLASLKDFFHLWKNNCVANDASDQYSIFLSSAAHIT